MVVELYRKGMEEIFYDHVEGDTTVQYFLMCEINSRHEVSNVVTFGYSPEYDAFFDLHEGELLSALKTRQDVEGFVVASEDPASAEYETSSLALFPTPEFHAVWAAFHRDEFDWFYDDGDE